MLNSGKKIKNEIFYLSCCPKTKILNETKNYNPPPLLIFQGFLLFELALLSML